MRKFINTFLFLPLSLFCLITNVNAVSGGYSGEGQGQGYTGGRANCSGAGCKCTGGACLASAAGIKFTLVNIGNSKIEAMSYGYMRSSGSYGNKYFDNNNVNNPGAIEGIILSNGDYDYGAYGKENYVELERFSQMANIIPSGQAGLNFYQGELKKNVLDDPNCSTNGTECILTDEFSNISELLLRRANIISSSDTLSTITNEQKNIISNLRIIIEPVYALYLNGYMGTKYIFSTPKSIAYKFASNDFYSKDPVLGISNFANSLYKQIYTTDILGTLINYPSYIVPSSKKEKIDSFLDLNTGAGYSIAKIIYENNSCEIREENGIYSYIDSYGNEWNNDSAGDNLTYYLDESRSGCGCTKFNESLIKTNLLNSNAKFLEIYKKECEELKSCEYEKSGSNYIFYGKKGNILSGYNDFINDCGCDHKKVDELKSIDGFASIYNNIGVCKKNNETYSGEVKNCNDSQSYEPANSNANFEELNLGYNKVTEVNDYCTEICDETINITNLQGKYTTKAGMYFEFIDYPNLVANKKCTVNIDYNKWYGEYYNSLKKLVDAYNPYALAKSAASSLQTGTCCISRTCGSDGKSCCEATSYEYDYTYPVISIVNNTNLRTTYSEGYDYSCGSPINWGVGSKLSDFQAQSAYNTSIANLKKDLKTCNNRLGINKDYTTSDDDIYDEQFYDFDQKLNYYYAQTYQKVGTKYNNERNSYGGIDDSNFVESKTKTSDQSGSGEIRYYDTLTENGVVEPRDEIYTYTSVIERYVQYEVDYKNPNELKYAQVFTGKISPVKIDNKSIYLGYVYDIDASALAKKGNEHYYSFTKLGDNGGVGKLFSNFKNSTNAINRYCDYEITNEIIETAVDGSNAAKLDVMYRTVDPNNIDPNKRLIDNNGNIIMYDGKNGFKNWRNEKGVTVLKEIQTDDTYNPENLEYSFTLDSATIQNIRNYNNGCDDKGKNCSLSNVKNYSNTIDSYSEITCNEAGNECTSKFITELGKNNGEFGSKIATNIEGRNTWKEYQKIDGKYYIDGKEIK